MLYKPTVTMRIAFSVSAFWLGLLSLFPAVFFYTEIYRKNSPRREDVYGISGMTIGAIILIFSAIIPMWQRLILCYWSFKVDEGFVESRKFFGGTKRIRLSEISSFTTRRFGYGMDHDLVIQLSNGQTIFIYSGVENLVGMIQELQRVLPNIPMPPEVYTMIESTKKEGYF